MRPGSQPEDMIIESLWFLSTVPYEYWRRHCTRGLTLGCDDAPLLVSDSGLLVIECAVGGCLDGVWTLYTAILSILRIAVCITLEPGPKNAGDEEERSEKGRGEGGGW